jgi:hypothetical protein
MSTRCTASRRPENSLQIDTLRNSTTATETGIAGGAAPAPPLDCDALLEAPIRAPIPASAIAAARLANSIQLRLDSTAMAEELHCHIL